MEPKPTATPTDLALSNMREELKQSDIAKLLVLQNLAHLLTNRRGYLIIDSARFGSPYPKSRHEESFYTDVNMVVNGRRLIMLPLKLLSRNYALLDLDVGVAEVLGIEQLTQLLTPRGFAAFVGRLNQHAHLYAEHREAHFPEVELPTRS